MPFSNIIYIGDGETDIPCFRLVKDQGGHSIAVYKPHGRKAKPTADKIAADGRVNFVAPANYEEAGRLDQIVKAIIDKLAADDQIKLLGKHI